MHGRNRGSGCLHPQGAIWIRNIEMPILMNLNELMVTFSASMKPTMILVLVLSTAVGAGLAMLICLAQSQWITKTRYTSDAPSM